MMHDVRLTQRMPTPSVTHHSRLGQQQCRGADCLLFWFCRLEVEGGGESESEYPCYVVSRIHQNRPASSHEQCIQHALQQKHMCIVGYVAMGEWDLLSKNGRAKWGEGGPGWRYIKRGFSCG